MRITTILLAVLMATLVLPATDAMAEDDVYRWVDENGVVHYGDLPPGQTGAEKVDILPSEGITASTSSGPQVADAPGQQEPQPSYAQQRRDERTEQRKEAAEKKEAVAAGCEQRRQLVAQLEPSTRVIVEYEDGTIGRLDDNERLQTLGEAKAYIAENCDN